MGMSDDVERERECGAANQALAGGGSHGSSGTRRTIDMGNFKLLTYFNLRSREGELVFDKNSEVYNF